MTDEKLDKAIDQHIYWLTQAEGHSSGEQLNLKNEDFSDRIMKGTLAYCKIHNCDFKRGDLYGSTFNNSDIRSSSFDEADLRKCHFTSTRFQHCSFRGARLQGATFSQCKIQGKWLRDANTVGADFRWANIYHPTIYRPKSTHNWQNSHHHRIYLKFYESEQYELADVVFRQWLDSNESL